MWWELLIRLILRGALKDTKIFKDLLKWVFSFFTHRELMLWFGDFIIKRTGIDELVHMVKTTHEYAMKMWKFLKSVRVKSLHNIQFSQHLLKALKTMFENSVDLEFLEEYQWIKKMVDYVNHHRIKNQQQQLAQQQKVLKEANKRKKEREKKEKQEQQKLKKFDNHFNKAIQTAKKQTQWLLDMKSDSYYDEFKKLHQIALNDLQINEELKKQQKTNNTIRETCYFSAELHSDNVLKFGSFVMTNPKEEVGDLSIRFIHKTAGTLESTSPLYTYHNISYNVWYKMKTAVLKPNLNGGKHLWGAMHIFWEMVLYAYYETTAGEISMNKRNLRAEITIQLKKIKKLKGLKVMDEKQKEQYTKISQYITELLLKYQKEANDYDNY